MQLNTRALLGLIPAAFIAPTNTATPVMPRADGYVIAMKIVMDGPQANTVGMTLKVAGEKMRVEMDMASVMGGRAGGAAAEGAYMLLQDNGKVAMILPNMPNPMGGGTGFGMSMDLAAVAGGGRGGRGGAAPIEASNVQVDVVDLGAGEAILGHPTRKYRVTSKSTVNGTPSESVTESWFATDLSGAEEGFKKFGQSFGAQFSGTSAKQVQDAMQAKMPKGFPLRSITSITQASGNSKVTMEVTQVTKMSFETAAFEIPAGVQLMDMGALMGGRGRGNH